MARIHRIVDSLHTELHRFRALPDERDLAAALTALDAVTNQLYKIREYRRKHNELHCQPGYGQDASDNYFDAAAADRRGRIAEGVIFVRGELTHDAVEETDAAHGHLYPGEHVYPGEDQFIGRFLRWRTPSYLEQKYPKVTKDKRWPYYHGLVGGRIVLVTLESAAEFLLDDSLLGRLDAP